MWPGALQRISCRSEAATAVQRGPSRIGQGPGILSNSDPGVPLKHCIQDTPSPSILLLARKHLEVLRDLPSCPLPITNSTEPSPPMGHVVPLRQCPPFHSESQSSFPSSLCSLAEASGSEERRPVVGGLRLILHWSALEAVSSQCLDTRWPQPGASLAPNVLSKHSPGDL